MVSAALAVGHVKGVASTTPSVFGQLAFVDDTFDEFIHRSVVPEAECLSIPRAPGSTRATMMDSLGGRSADEALRHPHTLLPEAREGPLPGQSRRLNVPCDSAGQRGELFTSIRTKEAENLRNAVALARGQGARSTELECAQSLARLWHLQGKRDDARHLLAEFHGTFTEGFDARDWLDAKAQLREWS